MLRVRWGTCCFTLTRSRICAEAPSLHSNARCTSSGKADSIWELQAEVEDLIWEVDEDCDQTVSWKEFQTMYQRCNNDTAGAT